MNRFGEEDFRYSFMLSSAGRCTLLQGDEVMWTSAGDRKFQADFGDEVVDEADLPAVQTYLEKENYLPPGAQVEYDPDAEEDDWTDDDDELDDFDDSEDDDD